METKKISIVAHGGAGSENKHSDGTEKAIETCHKAIKENIDLIHAVSLGVNVLENDGRYNAGSGSHARENGKVEHDAAIMDSKGRFGAVAAMKGFKNPIQAAMAVSDTKYRILAGEGAAKFAKDLELEPTPFQIIPKDGEDFSTSPSTDTVGCVAFDGRTFVAALSTGGMPGAHYGRVGDVPIIGSGLYAGADGAVAATGDGEAIMMKITAYRTYELIQKGTSPQAIVNEVISWFPSTVAFGLILVTQKGNAAGSNRSMAWSSMEFD
jgi:L-asparaginase / beta-aspartyl-peptidase